MTALVYRAKLVLARFIVIELPALIRGAKMHRPQARWDPVRSLGQERIGSAPVRETRRGGQEQGGTEGE